MSHPVDLPFLPPLTDPDQLLVDLPDSDKWKDKLFFFDELAEDSTAALSLIDHCVDALASL